MWKSIKVTARNAKKAKAMPAAMTEEPRANAPRAKSRAKSARWLWRLAGWLAGNRRLRNDNARLRAELSKAKTSCRYKDESIATLLDANERLHKQAYYARETLEGRHPKLGA